MQRTSRFASVQQSVVGGAIPADHSAVVSKNSFARHAHEIFKDALVARINGFQTSNIRAQLRLYELEEILGAKLRPRGEMLELNGSGPKPIAVYKTRFPGVSRHTRVLISACPMRTKNRNA